MYMLQSTEHGHAHERAFAHGALDDAIGTLTGRAGAAEPCATDAVVTCRSES